jgi:hypothetical protein
MDNNVRTVYGAYLQTCSLLGLDVEIKPNSTLNQKFNLYPNEEFNNGQFPTVKYVTIGNGGHTASIGVDGIPLVNPVPHSPRHGALYNHLPFIIREVTNDLTPTERLKYRLRVPATIDNVNYILYYAKVLDLSTVEPKMELRNISNNIITTTDFDPSLTDLNPVKPPMPPNNIFNATGNYLSTTAKVKFTLDASELTELINAVNIIYGNDNYAFISEIGLCTGVDRNLTTNIGGPNIVYTESVGTQVINFVNTAIPCFALNTAVEHTLDIGDSIALLFT